MSTAGRRIVYLWFGVAMMIVALVTAIHSPSQTNFVDQGVIDGKNFDPLRHNHREKSMTTNPASYAETIIASFDTLDDDTNVAQDNVSDELFLASTITSQSPLPRPGNAKNYRYQYVNGGSVVIRSYGNDSTCTVPSQPTTILPLNTCQSSTNVGGETGASTMFTLLVSQHRKTKATQWTVITSVYEDFDCVQLHHAHVYGQYALPSTCHLVNADHGEDEYTVIEVVRE